MTSTLTPISQEAEIHDHTSREPFLAHVTPNSVLYGRGKSTVQEIRVEQRVRLATCSGVAWFHHSCLATLNLASGSIHVYKFDQDKQELALIQALENQAHLSTSSELAVSPDGRWMAVSRSFEGTVFVYAIHPQKHTLSASPIRSFSMPGDWYVHGVCFSPDGRTLAYMTIDKVSHLRVCQFDVNAEGDLPDITVRQSIRNSFGRHKPKSAAYSPDGRFLVVVYSPNAGARRWPFNRRSRLAVFSVQSDRSLRSKPIFTAGDEFATACPEDVCFYPSGDRILISNQSNDTLVELGFNRATGELGPVLSFFAKSHAQLSFPHGVSMTDDGRYLAVANNGDDRVLLFALEHSKS
jgi:6-phosphogluconolactonase (cycloisomerase 2 family)